MTIAATGPLRTDAIRAEYGGGTPMRLGNYRRGNAAGWVKANGSGNVSTNLSAGVGTTVLRMSQFRGQAKGFRYTNTTTRISSGGTHYHCHTEFGTDWATTTWPCFYVNNSVMGSTDTGTYALVIYGRSTGPFTFTNNNEIQGAGGQPNSGAGQHAVYIYNSIAGANRPIFVNNYAVRGGGGAGGIGGAGGTGGQGYYNYTAEERPAYSSNYKVVFTPSHSTITGQGGFPHNVPASGTYYWGGNIGNYTAPAVTLGAYTYYRGSRVTSDQWGGGTYYIYRTWTASAVTSGGGGGGGGNGGRGIGYNSPNQGGLGGAGGGAPGTNAGWGGTGGAGGTGGGWGAPGGAGGTGYTGQSGNYSGGAGGTAGGGGGAAGYSIYAATPWGLTNTNTLNGPYGGAVAPS